MFCQIFTKKKRNPRNISLESPKSINKEGNVAFSTHSNDNLMSPINDNKVDDLKGDNNSTDCAMHGIDNAYIRQIALHFCDARRIIEKEQQENYHTKTVWLHPDLNHQQTETNPNGNDSRKAQYNGNCVLLSWSDW